MEERGKKLKSPLAKSFNTMTFFLCYLCCVHKVNTMTVCFFVVVVVIIPVLSKKYD